MNAELNASDARSIDRSIDMSSDAFGEWASSRKRTVSSRSRPAGYCHCCDNGILSVI